MSITTLTLLALALYVLALIGTFLILLGTTARRPAKT